MRLTEAFCNSGLIIQAKLNIISQLVCKSETSEL
jgi:hypothetical protein